MIRIDISETFPIIVSLIDGTTGMLDGGETVTYDIRTSSDTILSPPINGTLTESTVASGIYKAFISIPTAGNYICYASSSGYTTNTEDILVNPENVYNLVKQNIHYNTAVQDVVRTESSPNASQVTRNVPMGRTDYVITTIKDDDASDWSSTTTSGALYAWYNAITDITPYKMGGPS